LKNEGSCNRSVGVSFKSRLGLAHSETRQSGLKILHRTAREDYRRCLYILFCLARYKISRIWGVERAVVFL